MSYAFNPLTGNLDRVGAGGGSGSTSGIIYTDRDLSGSILSNSGSFAIATITLTLPSSPNQGDLCEFVVIGQFILTISTTGIQLIKLGDISSSIGGSIASSGFSGDSISFRFRTIDNTWHSTSSIGNWVFI